MIDIFFANSLDTNIAINHANPSQYYRKVMMPALDAFIM